MKLLGLAWKNLFSNVRRTFITLLAIIVGLSSLIFLWSFIDGLNEQMIENSTGYITGDIQIHHKGYYQSQEMNLALTAADGMNALLSNTPGIAGYSSRVEGTAMLSAGERTRGVKLFGVDPAQEPNVTRIAKSITTGRWFDGKNDNEIILGVAARDSFHLKLGDEVVLVTQAADGSLGADRYKIQGFFSTGIKQMDRQLAFIPLAAAQSLYAMEGRYTSIAIRVRDRAQVPSITRALRQKLDKHQEVYDWQAMLPSMVQMIAFHNAVSYVVLFIVFVVVGAGITNTLLMSVMERTREFGVMMAIGTQSTQILSLVLMETLLIAGVGMLLGTTLGVSITQYLSHVGLNLGQYSTAMETMPGLSGDVHPYLQMSHVLIVNLLVLLVTLVPALYPAWKASRLLPVTAIRGANISVFHLPGWMTRQIRTGFKFGHIAFRNIFRNPKRSLLTAGATAFGLAAFLFLYAFADGFFEQMIENSISNQSGHLQITTSHFYADLSPDKRIADYQKIISRINSKAKSQIIITPRVITHRWSPVPERVSPFNSMASILNRSKRSHDYNILFRLDDILMRQTSLIINPLWF
jgi:ABC-type lipoprotein release transport system permease subunit